MEKKRQCPRCGSEALNKYGRTHSGKQRFLCLVCRRQFAEGSVRKEENKRPLCPKCGQRMHVYMRREKGFIRFRCANYPECRTYLKIQKENTLDE